MSFAANHAMDYGEEALVDTIETLTSNGIAVAGAGRNIHEKFHYMPDSIKTMIAKAYVQDKRVQKVTYIPANINPDLEPVVLKRQDPRAQQVFDYVQQISAEEDLKARFSWDGDEVLVSG